MKDGTHPIRVPSTQFLDDYRGWMFASVTILDRLDYDTFERYETSFKKNIIIKLIQKQVPFNIAVPMVCGMHRERIYLIELCLGGR